MSQLPPLPPSEEIEGERIAGIMKPMHICDFHTKDHWMEGKDYRSENGCFVCTKCGWGTLAPGWLKEKEGSIIDLRTL